MKKFLYVAVTLPDRRIYYYADAANPNVKNSITMSPHIHTLNLGGWVPKLIEATLYVNSSSAAPAAAIGALQAATGAQDIEHKWVELES